MNDGAGAFVGTLLLMALLVGSLFVYFLPLFVASRRKHLQAQAIVVVNVFLGWTLLGWVGALVWANTAIPPAADGSSAVRPHAPFLGMTSSRL